MAMTLEEFTKKSEGIRRNFRKGQTKPAEIVVGMGTCGVAAGAQDVYDTLINEIKRLDLAVTVTPVGCIGMCEQETLVDVVREGQGRVTYGRMTPEKMKRVLQEHVIGGRVVEDLVVGNLEGDEEQPYPGLDFYRKQKRWVLNKCGFLDPEKMEEYLGYGGYQGLVKALSEMTPEQVIEEVKKSGLRGRGGAGFPTGTKWEFARKSPGNKKYIICNADEGDPGAYMDRSVLEGDPHAVIEGMIIGAYAIGANEGYIYVRAEYPLAVHRLEIAIKQAEEWGLLGDRILGTEFGFHLHIKQGAGAFVCGEETALMASIEGERGMPRTRPPFPAQKGLWGKPSNINNVETFANIPLIIRNGGAWYASVGTEKSKGTKVFALTGKIANTGLAEVPMGITMREIIYDIGGGIKDGKRFKAVQIGGPSGGCLPESLLDTPIDYDSLTQAGAIMGSGGLVVLDEETCMVDLARFFMSFAASESCGKCTPCREGTKRMLEILTKITEGKAVMEDLDKLEHLALVVKDASLCGLGQTAPNPVLTTLRYFHHEYEAHISEKKCPAGVCQSLIKYQVIPEKCTACGKCQRACPVGAITGKGREIRFIEIDRCIKCGACYAACPFDAIAKV